MAILIWYFVQQYKNSQSNIVSEARKQELLKKSIRNGLVNISGYLCNEIDVGDDDILLHSEIFTYYYFTSHCIGCTEDSRYF